MKKFICILCKKDFWSYESMKRKYCSLQCKGKALSVLFLGKKNPNYMKKAHGKSMCKICKKEFSFYKSCTLGWFCSHSCAAKYRNDAKSSQWKGGKIIRDGYIYIKIPGKREYIAKHRLIMEKHIGRKLNPAEIIHHKNHVKTDNRIENLQLITRGQHNKIHSGHGKIHNLSSKN